MADSSAKDTEGTHLAARIIGNYGRWCLTGIVVVNDVCGVQQKNYNMKQQLLNRRAILQHLASIKGTTQVLESDVCSESM